MRHLFKYDLSFTGGVQTVAIPQGADIITCSIEKGRGACIWALANSEISAPLMARRFLWVTGGDECWDEVQVKNFIGTVTLANGGITMFLFEIK